MNYGDSEYKKITTILVSIVIIILGLFFMLKSPSLDKNYKKTIGTVVDQTKVEVQERYKDDYNRTKYKTGYGYYPKVKYEVDGNEYEAEVKALSKTMYSIGSDLEIYYNKKNPADVRPKTTNNGALLFFGGIVLLVLTIFIGNRRVYV